MELTLQEYLNIEEKYSLFERKIDDMYYWEYIRFELWGLLENAGGKSKSISRNTKTSLLNKMIKLIFCDWKFYSRKTDILILSHYRKNKNKDGIFRCIYSEPIVNDLPYSILNFEIVPDNIEDYLPTKANTSYDIIDFFKYSIEKRILRKKYQGIFLKEAIYLKGLFEKYYDVIINENKLISIFENTFFYRKAHLKSFENVLKRVKPQIIVEVVSYNLHCIVMNEVAKKIGIPIIELQHGMISDQHVAYNSKYNQRRFFPDYFFAFSPKWIPSLFPLENEKIRFVGFPYLEEKKQELRLEKVNSCFNNNNKTILVVSQWTHSDFYIDFVKRIEENYGSSYNIILKIHPEDNIDDRYFIFKNKKNILIIRNEMNIYECFMQAEYQIGAYSTALFEGVSFGLKTFVFSDIQDSMIRNLVKEGYFKEIDSVEQFVKEIEGEEVIIEKEGAFLWEKNSKHKMLQEITNILEELDGKQSH